MVILDLIWPALYIAKSIYNFWFLVFITITIEAVFIKYFLEVTIKKAVFISIIGNLFSGIAGTILMIFVSLLYHTIADTLFFESTFNTFNWIASYLIMCFGSVLIEIIAVKMIWKYEFKKLLTPLAIGNIISYVLIIAFV